MDNIRVKGRVTFWNEKKGFGFITPNDGEKHIFAHIKAFTHCKKQPPMHQVVTYSISMDKQGRLCANMILRSGEEFSKKTIRKGTKSIIGVIAFTIIMSISTLTKTIPFLIFTFYFVISLFTFIMYAFDKSAAMKGTWRISEKTLHLLALVGGWPGAIIAQQTLRHKSKKQSFRIVFWITVFLNISVFIWWHTPTGNSALRALISAIL